MPGPFNGGLEFSDMDVEVVVALLPDIRACHLGATKHGYDGFGRSKQAVPAPEFLNAHCSENPRDSMRGAGVQVLAGLGHERCMFRPRKFNNEQKDVIRHSVQHADACQRIMPCRDSIYHELFFCCNKNAPFHAYSRGTCFFSFLRSIYHLRLRHAAV